jgi:hypothetical protein
MPSNPICCLSEVFGIKLEVDVPPIRVDTGYCHRAASHAIVKHQFTGVRVRANQVLKKGDRLLRGVDVPTL